jgi:hypothetical protein
MAKTGRIAQAQLYQPQVPKSSVKTGAESVTLTSEDLMDRVINIRFVHKPLTAGALPKTFTLRSDYEVMYTKTGFFYIDCIQKPAIKVSYKQVANSTVVELNVDISNLFIKDMTAMERSNGAVQQLEIQMGYKSQMIDWARDPIWSKKGISEFYALKDNYVAADNTGLVPPTVIVAQVLTTQRISAPPDGVTRFQCVVGTMEQGMRWKIDGSSTYVSTAVSSHWDGREPANALPSVFFELVTRRFIRPTQRHDITDVVRQVVGQDGVTVDVTDQFVTVYDNEYSTATPLETVLGRMSESDADLYGVVVYMSDVLWNTPLNELPMWNLTPEETAKAEPIEQPLPVEFFDKVPAQLEAIRKQYDFVRYYLLKDGNYFAYHVREKEADIFKDRFVNGKQKERIFKLPAVYDITWSGTRIIRSLFFSAIGSLDTVAFQSKYVLNDQTGNFYSPEKGNNCYLVLLLDVSFATEEDDNMMVLTCTDIAGDYEPETLPDGRIVPKQLPNAAEDARRDKIWKDVDLTVTYIYSGDPSTTDSSWSSIIERLRASALRYKDRWGTMPDNDKIIDDLTSWNDPGVFSQSRIDAAVSIETKAYGRDMPVIYGKEYNPVNPGFGDVIHIKEPYLPNYNDNEKIV